MQLFSNTRGAANPMENGRGDRFRYDEEGQLVEAWYNAADPANSGDGATRYDNFSYDALGNRFGWDYVASRGQWMNFTRKDNGLNQYRAWWPYSIVNYDDDIGGTWGSPGAANGVLMQDGWITAGYNALNQPILMTSAATGGNWMLFGYDPLGRCVKRWTGGLMPDGNVPPPDSNPASYFYYDGWGLIQDGPNASTISAAYILGNRLDDIVADFSMSNYQWLVHHSDARGHCTMLTDWGGNIMEQYEYDAFGYAYFYNGSNGWTGNTGSSAYGNRFLFTGREWLADVKLYDYRNRMYQPELGRFLQPDPKEFGAGDYNLYRYAHNDPVNKSDPFGDTDLAFYGPQDGDLNEGARNLPDSKAIFTVAGHGNENRGLVDTRTGKEVNISAHGLVGLISKAGGDSAKSITLYICEAGKGTNSLAQKVANETGKTVTAPTKMIWIDKKGGFSVFDAKRDSHGNPIVGPQGMEKNLKEPGVMKPFYPEGKTLKKDE